MRVFNVQPAARPAPWDRNPVNKTQFAANGAVAPHTTTVRWTYTVPAGKKAVLESLMMSVIRVTAAAPQVTAVAHLNYTPSGGSQTLLAQAVLTTNGVNDIQQQTITSLGEMLAGDVVSADDVDSSTGGTVSYAQTLKAFEFDA